MSLMDEVVQIQAAARRVELASSRLELTRKASQAAVDGSPGGTGPELLLAYHAAWVEMREAADAFVGIPRPLETWGEMLLATAEQPEGES